MPISVRVGPTIGLGDLNKEGRIPLAAGPLTKPPLTWISRWVMFFDVQEDRYGVGLQVSGGHPEPLRWNRDQLFDSYFAALQAFVGKLEAMLPDAPHLERPVDDPTEAFEIPWMHDPNLEEPDGQ